MLSDKSRPVIQATLPVVGTHIKDIAQCFYRRLFTTHPELLDGTFNRGNQADGTQQQALAGSVVAFATALVNTPRRGFLCDAFRHRPVGDGGAAHVGSVS